MSESEAVLPFPRRVIQFTRIASLEWPRWWRGRSLLQKVLPLVLVLAYWEALRLLGGFRGDHLTTGLVILVLSYGGPLTRPLFSFLLPLLLTGIIYDSQRFYSDYIRGPIHVQEPYLFDKRFFGISTSTGVLTPNEWCQIHTYPLFDLITGFAYLVFIAVFVLTAAYFVFWLGKTGTRKVSAGELSKRVPAIMWSFFWLNLIGYSTYYWYAAAPPWYVARYGLGPPRMDVGPSSAGCVRFDRILGTHFFSEMYGRSADVFGAIPSLHIAYPLLAIFFAFRFGAARVFSILFYLIMCFSAVYLNHHYILDILWGSSYAVLVAVVVDQIYLKRARRSESFEPTQSPIPEAFIAE